MGEGGHTEDRRARQVFQSCCYHVRWLATTRSDGCRGPRPERAWVAWWRPDRPASKALRARGVWRRSKVVSIATSAQCVREIGATITQGTRRIRMSHMDWNNDP